MKRYFIILLFISTLSYGFVIALAPLALGLSRAAITAVTPLVQPAVIGLGTVFGLQQSYIELTTNIDHDDITTQDPVYVSESDLSLIDEEINKAVVNQDTSFFDSLGITGFNGVSSFSFITGWNSNGYNSVDLNFSYNSYSENAVLTSATLSQDLVDIFSPVRTIHPVSFVTDSVFSSIGNSTLNCRAVSGSINTTASNKANSGVYNSIEGPSYNLSNSFYLCSDSSTSPIGLFPLLRVPDNISLGVPFPAISGFTGIAPYASAEPALTVANTINASPNNDTLPNYLVDSLPLYVDPSSSVNSYLPTVINSSSNSTNVTTGDSTTSTVGTQVNNTTTIVDSATSTTDIGSLNIAATNMPIWQDVLDRYQLLFDDNPLTGYLNYLSLDLVGTPSLPYYELDTGFGIFPIDFSIFSWVFDLIVLAMYFLTGVTAIKIIFRV